MAVTFATPGLFELLGIETQLGRFFTDEEDTGRAPVVVIRVVKPGGPMDMRAPVSGMRMLSMRRQTT